jgi:hypothetical protein
MRRHRFSIFGRKFSTFRCSTFHPTPTIDRIESTTVVSFPVVRHLDLDGRVVFDPDDILDRPPNPDKYRALHDWLYRRLGLSLAVEPVCPGHSSRIRYCTTNTSINRVRRSSTGRAAAASR